MSTKKFNIWLSENSNEDQKLEITYDMIAKLKKDSNISKWSDSKFYGSESNVYGYGMENIYKDQDPTPVIYPGNNGTLRIPIQVKKPSNIISSYSRLENLLDVNIIPDYFTNLIIIEFVRSSDVNSGSIIMDPVRNWNNRRRIIFNYNANDYKDLLDVINKGVDEAFEFFRDIRIVVPADLKKIPGVKTYMENKVREIYNKMLDEIKETGDVEGELDDNIFSQLIITILEEHPNLIDDFNNLPERAKDKWLSGAKEMFKDKPIEITKETLVSIKAYLNIKKAFYLM
jgi:hypothetical protein